MKKIAFINGTVVDPVKGISSKTNILLAGGKIAGLGYLPDDDEKDMDVHDLEGLHVFPHPIDACVNVAELYDISSDYETLEDFNKVAAAGGLSSFILSPEFRNFVVDSPQTVRNVRDAARSVKSTVYASVAILRQTGETALSELVLAKMDDAVLGMDISGQLSDMMLRNVFQYARMLRLPLMFRPVTPGSLAPAVMNEGEMATILGLPGSPPLIEAVAIYRLISFLRTYGGQLCIFPVTTAEGLQLIRSAKKEGLHISCGTSPHYLVFTDRDTDGYNVTLKVCPPLRGQTDQAALVQGLVEGTIDFLASDHRACHLDEKQAEFAAAQFGVCGSQYLIPLALTLLHRDAGLSLEKTVALFSANPVKVFELAYHGIALNNVAHFSVFDLKKEAPVAGISKGVNDPYKGRLLQGECVATVSGGQVTFLSEKFQNS